MLTRNEFLKMALAVALPPERAWELSNEFFRIRIACGTAGVWLDQFIPAGISQNMLIPNASGIERSGTGLLADGAGWQFSWLPTSGSVQREDSRLRISGVLIGPEPAAIAREDWDLSLNGPTFTWRIRREFLRDVHLVADRFPAIVIRTVSHDNGTTRFVDIPSFLDLHMRLDGTKGFPLHIPVRENYEVISAVRSQALRFSPSRVQIASELATGLFSYAKPFSDGTSEMIAFGAESVDRERGPVSRLKGARQSQTWTLKMSGTAQTALKLDLPDRFLTDQSASFATVHNQWMGWQFGNNPGSTPVLQEMAWFPMIQSLFPRNSETLGALTKELLFFANSAVGPDGYVMPRWGFDGFYKVQWGNFLDQIPHFILGIYFHALNTGDRDFVRKATPALDRVARFMLALDSDGDGVFEMTGSSGLPDGGRHCDGWFDIVNFGHKDGLINAWCVAALDKLAELKAWMGDAAAAADFRARHTLSVAAYNRIFWDDARDLYMDWIDVREKMPESGRRYFYADPNMLAIVFGIADHSNSARILAHMDRRYNALCRQFRLPREAIYATPANLYSVTQLGDLVDFGKLLNQKVYPNYENGCSFFHSTGFEIAARGMTGQKEQALDAFARVMRYGYSRNRLWAAALKWDTGELISEPLNNALLILWGFVRGCLGVRPTLNGLKVEGECSKRLEGARHTFCHLGRDVTVVVQDGKPRVLG